MRYDSFAKVLRTVPVVLTLLVIGARLQGEPSTGNDRWYVVRLAGQPTGWMHTVTQHANERIITRSKTKLVIRRGPIQLKIELESMFVETEDGRAIRGESRQLFGGKAVTQEMTFGAEGIELVSRQGGRETKTTTPLPEAGFLPPAAADREMQRRFDDGAKEVTLRTMDPSVGPTVIEVTTTKGKRRNIEVFGKVVPATEMLTRMSIMPQLVTHEYVDDQGEMVRSTMTMLPGMEMEVLEADEDLAKARIDPPELVAGTLIHPSRPLADARGLKRAKYRVTIERHDGDRGSALKLPQAGYQRVEVEGDDSVVLTVDTTRAVDATNDPPTDAHRRASIMIDGDDPQVRRLTKQALSEVHGSGAMDKALGLRDFVRSHIKAKDLSVGFATASEVARTAEGDCTEHAVLLAAMLRAAAIPSRTVSGLVYVPRFVGRRDVFGYHMWAQAWIADSGDAGGGRWVDVDAAIGDRAFDAAHIALNVADLADARITNDMVALFPLIGRLKIEVLETSP